MADVSSPIPMGAAPEKHNWLLIAGAVAGVAGLFLLLKNQGNQGTVAAGTSINAALGSIQEENMNLLGTTQAGFQGASQQLGAAESNIVARDLANTQNVTNAVNQGFTGIGQQVGALQTGQTQVLANQGQIESNLSALQNLVSSGQAQSQANFGYLANLENQLGGQNTTLYKTELYTLQQSYQANGNWPAANWVGGIIASMEGQPSSSANVGSY